MADNTTQTLAPSEFVSRHHPFQSVKHSILVKYDITQNLNILH